MGSWDIFLLYLLTRLDVIQCVATGALSISCVVTVIFGLIGWVEESRAPASIAQKASIVAVAMTAILIVIPSKQDVMFILASAGIVEAAQSDASKRIAGKSVEVFEQYLDKMLEDKKGGE